MTLRNFFHLGRYIPQMLLSQTLILQKCPSKWANQTSHFSRTKHTIDHSLVPKLEEEDLEEMFVRGSGPGGQNVNKTNNCVVLTHRPSGKNGDFLLVTSNVFNIREKHTIDSSHIPTLREEDFEEQFVRGSGPGGSAVNKNSNCVVLIHKPSGIVVKCHQSRSQDKNRKLARQMLVTKLDNLLNGDGSVEAQQQAILDKKTQENKRRKKKLYELKAQWKEREGLS
uniref:Prokaryotic-type class I peptide chain release factors domain-containing protein n=1 Tax=Timema cristinae TaxID=61476 RepID=A0A7R9CGB0_TIMCR|nr:unnamed protein product [Timema cristinae]